MRIKICSVITLLIICLAALRGVSAENVPGAAVNVSSSPAEERSLILKDCLNDAGAVVISPLRWDKSDFIKLGIISAAEAGVFLCLDDSMEDYAEKLRHNELNDFSEKMGYLGGGLFIAPAFGAMYVYGGLTGGARTKNAAIMGLESYSISSLLVTAVKISVHRPRPKDGSAYNKVSEQNFFSKSNLSFPSGHSAAAFSSARIMAWYYKDKPLASYIAYGLASLVAWSRVNDREHWPSDVLAGSVLGYFTAGKIITLNKQREKTDVSLFPFFDRYAGLTAVYRF